MNKNIGYVLGLLGFLVVGFGLTGKASAATLTLTPSSGTVTAGQTVSVDIMLDTTGASIDGVDIYSLHYNPRVLEVQDANTGTGGVQITPGNLLPLTLINMVNPINGTIQFSQVTQGGTTYSGAGKFATVVFKGIYNGTSSVTFDHTIGSTSDTNVAGSGVEKLTSVGNASFTVTGGTENPYPPSGSHPNGTLVLDGSTVWLIKNQTRYGFRNPEEYKSYGYNFGQLVTASTGDMSLSASSTIIKAMEGTLVIDASDNVTVYMVGTGAAKRGFVSEAVFKGLGYKFGNLPKINLSDYSTGVAISNAALAHPDGALVLQSNGTVWWIRGNTKQGFESAAVFNTYGFGWDEIVPANAADLALTEGAAVKFRDGTLVTEGGAYYIISDGKKLNFSSSNDLVMRGYKTSNAISASLSAYQSGGTVQ